MTDRGAAKIKLTVTKSNHNVKAASLPESQVTRTDADEMHIPIYDMPMPMPMKEVRNR